jgi:serine/threonine protein kinase
MAETDEPLLQTCEACGTEIDVSAEEPLAAVQCPNCGTPLVVAAQIDQFELIEVLGRGGMGVVYRAMDTSLNRPVALKLLRKSEGADGEKIAQLATEASITASINHPHVVKVFTTGLDHGRFYIAMELVDKGTLDNLIDLQGRVAESQVLEVGTQIAQGLRAAQQVGLIHRDVKPGNILFADAHTAKIVDFGLAIFAEDEAKVRGEIWGTPYYVAPEKLDNKPEDFRSDIYSLGGTLFHALAGRPPFEAENASLVALKHLKSQAVSLQAFAPWVSGSTAFVINRTLNKDPDQRYQSYDELIEHLDYARNELQNAKPQESKRIVLESEEEKKAMGWVVFAMLGAIVAIGIGAYVFRDSLFQKEETPTPAAAASPAQDAKTASVFPEERAKLEEGNAAAAAEAFRKAAEQPRLAPVQVCWANLLEGLSELTAGHRAEATAAFRKIENRGPFSQKPQDEKLADFFMETARQMSGNQPIPAAAAAKLDASNHEAIALLLYGAKDWDMGKIDDAVGMLRQFRQTTPGGRDAWIGELKTLATKYLEEFTEFDMAASRLKSATTPNDRKAAIEALRKIRGKLASRATELADKAPAITAEANKPRANPPAAAVLPDGTYKVTNRKSGKALDVEGQAKEDGHKVQQWGYTGGPNQKWKLTAVGGGYYELVCVDSGKALDVPDGQSTEGLALRQWSPNKAAAQRWKVEKTDGGFFKLTAECSGKVLAAAGDFVQNGGGIVQASYTGAPEQQWKLDAL